jgi:ankyrin repeat protein
MDMCRFTGLDDVEYKKVAAALHRMTRMVSRQERRGEIPTLNEEQRRTLMDSMRFDRMDARQMTIKRAHAKTCKWLLKKSEYLDWLDAVKLHEHHGFLWIKGKPGTGKSTMMKFALGNSRKMMNDRIIISFFFNARGADLEKSTTGMYRSLLLQLLERLPELQCVFDSLGFATWNSSGHHQWSVELLKDLFEQAIQILGQSSVMCFIDALDECDECQIRDMVTFFQHLGELTVSAGIRFQVCFSSRHYPHITIRKGLSLVLEGQEGHIHDITSYIDSELKIGRGRLAEQIRVELQEKASGVFMWVVLVVDILNKEHDGGRIHALRKRLRDIPSDLHELFRDILTRDYHNRNELLLCIQWLLFARQPLKPEELYHAILSVNPQDLPRWDSDEIEIDTIKKFILNSSKGLAEITKSKTLSVQFIHESVRDFLLKENGLRAVWSSLGSNFQGQSHERLKQCCLNYMSIDIATHLNIDTPLPKASSQEAAALRLSVAKIFPFLQYAVQNVLYHADVAEGEGVNQKDFVQNFQLADWINLDNLFERHEIRRHTPNVSLLYILAEGNMSNLIRVHPSNLSCFEVENERYGLPLFAALATGSDDAVRTFLETQAEIQPQTSPLHGLCKQYCQDRNKRTNFGRDFTFSPHKGVLSYVAEHGDEILLAFLLSQGECMPDSKDKSGRTPLSRAAENGHEPVVKLLLAKDGIDPNSKDSTKYERTPLMWAAIKGHEPVVKLLLAKDGVNPDSKDTIYGQTPLSWAARNGHEPVVKLLLAKDGVDPDSKDQGGRTPLWWAAMNGYELVVKLLLAKDGVDPDFDPDFKDKTGQPPLWWAAMNGHGPVVKMLLAKYDVDPDPKDKSGRTPLSWAAEKGHEPMVKLLLAKDSVDPDSKDQWAVVGRNERDEPGSGTRRSTRQAAEPPLCARARTEAVLKDDVDSEKTSMDGRAVVCGKEWTRGGGQAAAGAQRRWSRLKGQ